MSERKDSSEIFALGEPDGSGGAPLLRDSDPRAGDPGPEAAPDPSPSGAPPEPSAAPSSIAVGQRILFVGMPGKGKSEGLLNAFANYRGQRVLIDVQDHYTLGPDALAEQPPPLVVDDPREIDWRHRTVHYIVRRPGDLREMDRLHAAIYNQGSMFVACDEAEDVAPSRGAGAAFYVKKCLKQGRKRQITYGAATQRPFGVDRSVTMQAEHACVFPMVDNDDLRAISARLGMSVRELAAALERLGPFEYLRHTVGDGRVLHMPALPPAAVEFTRRHVLNPQFTERG